MEEELKGSGAELVSTFLKRESLLKLREENLAVRFEQHLDEIGSEVGHLEPNLAQEEFFRLQELLSRLRYEWWAGALKGGRVLTAVFAKTRGPLFVYCVELNLATFGLDEQEALNRLKEEVVEELKRKIYSVEEKSDVHFEIIQAKVE